jgi:hypothetical protein
MTYRKRSNIISLHEHTLHTQGENEEDFEANLEAANKIMKLKIILV